MTSYNIKLLRHEEVAKGTMAFYFKKPQGFAFKEGQHAEFTELNPPETDDEGNKRVFSLASPSYAEDLMIATRMRDTAFKHSLEDFPSGTDLKLDGPYGSFTLHNNAKIPAVFLTGGIGITPVRSILMQAAREKFPHKIFLFYSNKRPEDAAFLDKLKKLEQDNPNYKFIGTMTDMQNSKQEWGGETGYINEEMLRKYVQDVKAPIYYISGPGAMVTAMRSILDSIGVDSDNIRTEEFAGY
jgi:ferredoxin-NADP reductase